MRSKKALLNIITNLILEVIVIVYGFIVPKIIITKFGSSVNGLVSSITQFLAYITLLEAGFGPVVKSVLYKPIAEKDNKTIASILNASEKFFRKLAVIFLVYIIILCALYPFLVNKNFGYLYTCSLIIIISIGTFTEYFFGMTYKLFLQAEQKKYIGSIVQIITYIFTIATVYVLAKFDVSIHIIKLVTCAIFVFRPLIQNLYVKKKYNIDFTDADKDFEIKQKWDGLAQHIAAVVHGNTDITLLTIFVSLAEISVYSVYRLIVNGIKQVIQAFTGGIDASFGDMYAKGEKENLNKKFDIYEVLYNMVVVVLFSCTMVLIVPFVMVYTKGITDANYIRYTFGTLIVISEFIWAIRLPYSSITLAAGHFKETRKGAWVECISNIVISSILVIKYGLEGAAVGTIVAMTIRTIEFVYHTNKYILERPIVESVKKILVVLIETLLIIIICHYLPFVENTNYLNWVINAILTGIVACFVTLIVNTIVFTSEIKEVMKSIMWVFKRKKSA